MHYKIIQYPSIFEEENLKSTSGRTKSGIELFDEFINDFKNRHLKDLEIPEPLEFAGTISLIIGKKTAYE